MDCEARPLVAGAASGLVVSLSEPLSFWGGFDTETGDIIDVHHPQRGSNLTGCILVVAHGRGSSSSSSVLAEAIRLGTAPAGIVLSAADEILVLGALVAAELYGNVCPIVVVGQGDHEEIGQASQATITAKGSIRFD